MLYPCIELYFNLKDFIKAEEIFNCGLVEKKMIAECFLGLGLIKKQEDKFLEAKEYFIKSLREKELVNTWLNLGELYDDIILDLSGRLSALHKGHTC